MVIRKLSSAIMGVLEVLLFLLCGFYRRFAPWPWWVLNRCLFYWRWKLSEGNTQHLIVTLRWVSLTPLGIWYSAVGVGEERANVTSRMKITCTVLSKPREKVKSFAYPLGELLIPISSEDRLGVKPAWAMGAWDLEAGQAPDCDACPCWSHSVLVSGPPGDQWFGHCALLHHGPRSFIRID